MKVILIIALILVIIGLVVLGTSAYFAVAYYFPGAEKSSPAKTNLIDEKLDIDGDGLTDKEEKEIYHTDPYNKDTDGDGYSDKQEIDSGFDPLTAPK